VLPGEGCTHRVADLDHVRGDAPPFQDHGRVEPTAQDRSRPGAARVQPALRTRIDYDDVIGTLEREGIEMFIASLDPLLDQISAKRRGLTARA
jgi:hypothetical protein